MFQVLKKRIKNEKGLSLVELLAVIVILGIVAAIAIPAIGNIIENSRYNAVKSDAINVLNAANLYFTEDPTKTSATTAELKTAGFLESGGIFEKQNVTATVAKVSGGNTISAAAVTYSGAKTATFTGATVNGINKDTAKGSDTGDRSITE